MTWRRTVLKLLFISSSVPCMVHNAAVAPVNYVHNAALPLSVKPHCMPRPLNLHDNCNAEPLNHVEKLFEGV